MKIAEHAALLCAILCASGAQAFETPAKWALAGKLYSDTKARAVGDLLTVLIVESSSSTKEASSKTAKQTSTRGSLNIAHPKLDNAETAWTNATIPQWGASATRGFEGSGEMKNSESITATLTVRVIEVLPNGNLLIEGKRILQVMEEEVQYMLSGTVRPNDISRDNTVRSTHIGELSVQYVSAGSISKSQQKGIFDSLIDFVNPF